MTGIPDRLSAALADRYRIERELGQGGMATVYLAADLKHDRKVAIKVLREDLSASVGKDRFLREIKVAASLQHPHVLPLYDSGEADGLLFYVMPFVDGLSLREKLTRDGELPIGDAVRILRDLADALSEAHRHGVVHRDLKPENVMLRGRHALVTDFGVAKALSEATGRHSLTTMGVALGTPTYMAPEQAVADPNTDHRADLYAFGIVAYELLTGRPPFSGRSPQQVLAAHVTATPEPITNHRVLPAQIAALVMQCLEKNPGDRPQSAEELIPQLESAMTSSGGITPTETAPHRAQVHATATRGVEPASASTAAPASGRHLRRGAIVAAALAVLALAWMAFGQPQTSAPRLDELRGQIAVLPFENIGGDTANAYLADGMTDELATALAKMSELRVASRTSSYAFRDVASRDLTAIRSALKAGSVIEGTVSRAGDQVRISARLTNTGDGVEIWSDAFVRDARNVFAVQNEVARAIIAALVPALPGPTLAQQAAATPQPRGTDDAVAYDLTLRARHLWYQRGIASLRQSAALYQEAAQRDPQFARAFAGLAMARVTLADYEGAAPPTLVREVEQAAARASELDPTSAEPQMALGFLWGRVHRAAEAEAAFERAIRLDPRSSTARHWYGNFLWASGRTRDAVTQLQLAAEFDPLSAIIAANFALALAEAGRKDEAIAMGNRAVSLDPRNALVLSNMALMLTNLGRHQEALTTVAEAERAGEPAELTAATRSLALVSSGDSAAARDAVRRGEAALGERANRSANMASAYAAVGERSRALAVLGRSIDAKDWQLPYAAALRRSSAWASLLNDPAFEQLLQRLEAFGR